jgi:hypothetical protein
VAYSDMMQFPVSMPQDGLIDIMVWEHVRRHLQLFRKASLSLCSDLAQKFSDCSSAAPSRARSSGHRL